MFAIRNPFAVNEYHKRIFFYMNSGQVLEDVKGRLKEKENIKSVTTGGLFISLAALNHQ